MDVSGREPETVDVIVPTWQRPDELARCLASLAQQNRLPNRVLVVARIEDAAARDVAQEWRDRVPGLVVIDVDRPGQVAALNTGLAATAADVIAVFDDDAEPDPDWLERALAMLRSDPSIGGVCGRDRMFVEGSRVGGHTDRRIGSVTWFGRITGLFHLGPDSSREVAHLKGCAMAFRGLATAGVRFDERLHGAGAQPYNDTVFSMAVRARGWRLVYDGALQVTHRQGPRSVDDSRPDVFRRSTVEDWAHNEILVVFGALGLGGRVAARIWMGLVGSRTNPGLIQFVRLARDGRSVAWLRWSAARRGRSEGRRTWRDTSSDARR